jgi:hypothetical protein
VEELPETVLAGFIEKGQELQVLGPDGNTIID